MKKNFRGFTLVELIIVMFILTILMAGIMQMFKPIRETYVDSTLYESQRTSQNGVVQYITESVRYSTDLGMYTKNKVTDVEGAAAAFTTAYLEAYGVQTSDPDYSTKYSKTLDKVKRNAEVIIIDNSKDAYTYGGVNYTGRILRRKFQPDTLNVGMNLPLTGDAEVAGSSECRLALGAAYYGDSSYTIALKVKQDASGKGNAADGIEVTVASGVNYGLRNFGARSLVDADKLDESNASYDTTIVKTSGLVMCKNQCAPINGMFDTTNYDAANASGVNTKIYIVYLNDKIQITA